MNRIATELKGPSKLLLLFSVTVLQFWGCIIKKLLLWSIKPANTRSTMVGDINTQIQPKLIKLKSLS